MILFREEHRQPILDDSKTQTRRLGKRRWNVGAIHQCYTRPAWVKPNPGTPFARVEIAAVRRERLGDISLEDARREGYASPAEYFKAFAAINGQTVPGPADDKTFYNQSVWVVDFWRVG